MPRRAMWAAVVVGCPPPSAVLGSRSVAGKYFSPLVIRMAILVGPCFQPLKHTTGHAPCKPQVDFNQMSFQLCIHGISSGAPFTPFRIMRMLVLVLASVPEIESSWLLSIQQLMQESLSGYSSPHSFWFMSCAERVFPKRASYACWGSRAPVFALLWLCKSGRAVLVWSFT